VGTPVQSDPKFWGSQRPTRLGQTAQALLAGPGRSLYPGAHALSPSPSRPCGSHHTHTSPASATHGRGRGRGTRASPAAVGLLLRLGEPVDSEHSQCNPTAPYASGSSSSALRRAPRFSSSLSVRPKPMSYSLRTPTASWEL
jgi:hypothetical protein